MDVFTFLKTCDFTDEDDFGWIELDNTTSKGEISNIESDADSDTSEHSYLSASARSRTSFNFSDDNGFEAEFSEAPKHTSNQGRIESSSVPGTDRNNSIDGILFTDELSDDDEIWLMQCPTSVSEEMLLNKYLHLDNSSESAIQRLETDGREFKMSIHVESHKPFSCLLPSQVHNSMKIVVLQPNGNISLSETFNTCQSVKTETLVPNTCTISFPTNLKVRHPLFGADYEHGVRPCSSSQIKSAQLEHEEKKLKHMEKKRKHLSDQSTTSFISNRPSGIHTKIETSGIWRNDVSSEKKIRNREKHTNDYKHCKKRTLHHLEDIVKLENEIMFNVDELE